MNPELEFNYEFQERLDHIKGNWYLWSVTRTRNSNGISHYGTIEADYNHNTIAHDSFRIDE